MCKTATVTINLFVLECLFPYQGSFLALVIRLSEAALDRREVELCIRDAYYMHSDDLFIVK